MKNSLILLFAVLLLGSAARAADGTSKESYTYARTVLVNLPGVRPDRTYRLTLLYQFHSAPSPRDATRWFSWPMPIDISL